MTKNKELAKATLAKIEQDLERWNQSSYGQPRDAAGKPLYDESHVPNVCGTTFCFGGHAALLSGAKFSPTVYLKDAGGTGWRDKSGHRIDDIEGFAAKKLGLDWQEANRIFYYIEDDEYGDPITFEQLRERVEEVFDL